jgi:hypothetical protein
VNAAVITIVKDVMCRAGGIEMRNYFTILC